MKKKKSQSRKGEIGKMKIQNRKLVRKKKRDLKKEHRRDYYARRWKSTNELLQVKSEKSKQLPEDSICNAHKHSGRVNDPINRGVQRKFDNKRSNGINVIFDNDNQVSVVKNHTDFKAKKNYKDPLVVRKMQEEAEHHKLLEAMHSTRSERLIEANEEEDKVIKKLEKQLKLTKRKSRNVPKPFIADGLDYLLDVCDSEKLKKAAILENALENSDSELEDDLTFSVTSSFEDMTKKGQEGNWKLTYNKHSKEDEFNKSISYKEDSNDSTDENWDGSETSSESNVDLDYYVGIENNVTAVEQRKTSIEGILDKNIDTVDHSLIVGLSSKTKKNSTIQNEADKGFLLENEIINPKSDMSVNNLIPSQKRKQKNAEIDASAPAAKTFAINRFDKPRSSVPLGITEESIADHEVSAVSSEEKNEDILWEDIYGRTRDKCGNIITSRTGTYVPPALRAQQSIGADEEAQHRMKRLKRQVKGLMNRLTEQNLPSISNEMDSLYNSNSRNDMNQTFESVISESLVSPVLSLERLIMEHIALVACLHSKVGNDVGAYILQAVIKRFDSLFKTNPVIENKELDNVVLIICYLYHFKVIHNNLVFDILHCLADRFGSKDLELILLTLRCISFGLRKDNPSEMKSLMIQLQEQAIHSLQKCNEARVKFMLEVLAAVKNNNIARVPGWDPEPQNNMRKILRSILGSGTSPELNISLRDLLEADEKGRWWIVGSAWVGQPSTTAQQKNSSHSTYNAELLQLANRMRMNTEVRRNIFCILMSAQDFNEAFTNLMQLGLKGMQSREIIHVTLECCLQEKSYNKFYSFVLQSLCEYNRDFRMTLLHDVWNKFDELQNLGNVQFTNLGKLLQHLLVQGVLNLMVFKKIDLASLEKTVVRLMRQVLLGILIGNLDECNRVFICLTQHSKHYLFMKKILVFLQKFVLNKLSPSDPKKTLIQERIDCLFMSHNL